MRTAGMAGAAWSPAVSTMAHRLPEVGAWRSKLAQAVPGQRRVGFDLVVVVGVVGSGRFDRVVDQERLDARRIAVGRQLATTTLRGHCVRPRAESPRL
jgi:hypothetical protein